MRILIYLVAVLAVCLPSGHAIQQFQNLDFEQATVEPTPVGGYAFLVDPADAFPGWTVATNAGIGVVYNNLTLGGQAEVLIGPYFPNWLNMYPLQGSYSAILQFGPGFFPYGPSLSQTGTVPAGTRSISFLATWQTNILQVSLNGTVIPLTPIAGERLAGDVSSFAGQTAELKFTTTLNQPGVYFDDIQFSPATVPEPSALFLLAMASMALLFTIQRNLTLRVRQRAQTVAPAAPL